MEADKNPMPHLDLFPKITRVAKCITRLFSMHQLASHGDHFDHPLDTPIEPVTSLPGQPEYESAGSYYFRQDIPPDDAA